MMRAVLAIGLGFASVALVPVVAPEREVTVAAPLGDTVQEPSPGASKTPAVADSARRKLSPEEFKKQLEALGYKRPFDPESSAVTRGRRDAPLVSMRLSGGRTSLRALGQAVIDALNAGNIDSLRVLCIDREELRVIFWPEMPQSRPATGLTVDDAWQTQGIRLFSGTNGAMSDYGGKNLELVRVDVMGVARFRNFRLHRGITLVTRDSQGTIYELKFLRSVAERKGRFKIWSTTD